MPAADIDGITIEYDTIGDPEKPAVLLVAGLGNQLIAWEEEAVRKLTDRGYFAIRYDHRDVGLSTRFDGHKAHIEKVWPAMLAGEEPEVAYTLSDMAADGIGLLDHLDITRAHIVGVSMGGMIAQLMAVEHPQRLKTLTSIMSTTGASDVGQATPPAAAILIRGVPDDRDAAIESGIDACRITWGPYFYDTERARRRVATAYDRAFYPEGAGRQMAAVLACGDRTERLASVTVPTLVIHGDADPLIDVSGGYATAAAIPDADLLIVDRMGHDIPPQRLDMIGDAIVSHLRRHG
jgi:pimeloyl-ACP methyl ester carboxylesterase